jgi:putative chitinase
MLAMMEFGIDTGERPAMFLAQVAHESSGFRYVEEIWGNTDAQLRYEGRRDLGNTQPGDGRKFCGHGLLQITGRKNHEAEAQFFGVDVDAVIPLLMSPLGACRSAAHWWHTHGCNALADAYDFVGLTQRINGGLNGLDDRLERYKKICAISVTPP